MLVTQSCLTLCKLMDYIACQTPPIHGILQARKEYWSGCLFTSPGNLPNSGIKPGSPAQQADSLQSEPQGSPIYMYYFHTKLNIILKN